MAVPNTLAYYDNYGRKKFYSTGNRSQSQKNLRKFTESFKLEHFTIVNNFSRWSESVSLTKRRTFTLKKFL
jgi:hypothetical protein